MADVCGIIFFYLSNIPIICFFCSLGLCNPSLNSNRYLCKLMLYRCLHWIINTFHPPAQLILDLFLKMLKWYSLFINYIYVLLLLFGLNHYEIQIYYVLFIKFFIQQYLSFFLFIYGINEQYLFLLSCKLYHLFQPNK